METTIRQEQLLGGDDILRHALLNQWCSYGCPERMKIHDKKTGKTYRLFNGSLTDENWQIQPNRINRLRPRISVSQPTTPLSVSTSARIMGKCLYCNESFVASRKSKRFCNARHRLLYFKQQKAARLMESIA